MRIINKNLIILAAALLTPHFAHAQGTTYLSNIGQASTGSEAVADDSWQAATFLTGNNAGGYVLNSIQLGMTDASGNPSGFSIMIYTNAGPSGLLPLGSLGDLSGSVNPATAGVFTFTDVSSITLSPNTPYYIVLTAGTGVATGTYNWSLAATFSYNPTGAWSGLGGVWTSGDGSFGNSTPGNLQFAINATPVPVPEPGVSALFILGGLCLLWHRRRARVVS